MTVQDQTGSLTGKKETRIETTLNCIPSVPYRKPIIYTWGYHNHFTNPISLHQNNPGWMGAYIPSILTLWDNSIIIHHVTCG